MEPVLCHRTDSIAALLGVPQGLTAIVGGGGKTTLMYRLAGEPAVRGTSDFSDVAPESYYSKAVLWAG